ncbi:MAG: phosphoribosyltransferase family protein [Balneolales bacterium]
MNYISFADMGKTIVSNLYKIPQDVDLIVGIPRSGLLAGNLIALSLNIPIIDFDGFIDNRKPRHGFSRKTKTQISFPRDAKHVLIVDDTIFSGKSLAQVKDKIERATINQQMTYCTVYAAPNGFEKVDIFFERLFPTTVFEWNIMQCAALKDSCIDIDGVLCMDPLNSENNDGPGYLNFLKNARPLSLPSLKVGYLVTNRLEKYRKETEAWLSKHNIQYKKLHMLDLPDAETRKRHNNYASFKALIYKSYPDSHFFIESNKSQAIGITRLAGKPVLCFSDKKLYTPELLHAPVDQKAKAYRFSITDKVKRITWHLLSSPEVTVKQPAIKNDMLKKKIEEKQYKNEISYQD